MSIIAAFLHSIQAARKAEFQSLAISAQTGTLSLMQPLIIHLIAGARPNFMKIAPLFHALKKEPGLCAQIVHTGQHYDFNMSDSFFADLMLPPPDFNLGVGSGTHAGQTARVMLAYEEICLKTRPDLTVVVGDVNSTVACSLVAAKLGIRLAHLEAGLRSFDRAMPEELNRLVTDVLSDFLWTHCADADHNLEHEGVPAHKIKRVGNIMIDSLEMLRPGIEAEKTHLEFGASPQGYALVTLHRPSNVDHPQNLAMIASLLKELGKEIPVIFPIHPRTRKNMENSSLNPADIGGISLCDPLPYRQFMSLLFNCKFVLTDSGGIQEETTYLGVPCLTLRDNTERPVTVTLGSNRLCNLQNALSEAGLVMQGKLRPCQVPELWDGKTAPRVVAEIRNVLSP